MPVFPSYNSSVVSAIGHVESGVSFPKFAIGGVVDAGGLSNRLYKKSTTYSFSFFRTKVYMFDRPFNITGIEIHLGSAMSANQTLIPVLGFDNETNIVTGTTINNTNYPNSEKIIRLSAANFDYNVHGRKNFYLDLNFTGTALMTVLMPLKIEVETEDKV